MLVIAAQEGCLRQINSLSPHLRLRLLEQWLLPVVLSRPIDSSTDQLAFLFTVCEACQSFRALRTVSRLKAMYRKS